jgi:formylglycine-generating enzyme required for sulfatase activity
MSTAPLIRGGLQERLHSARRRTDSIFGLVAPAALYSRPIPERHRLIFYLGHLEAFDWNLICRKTLEAPSFHPQFDALFEFGIDPPVGQAAADQPSDWPRVDEIQTYNKRVRGRIDELLDRAPDQIIHVALEHRLMHAETLAYLLHNLPYGEKASAAAPPLHSTNRLTNPMIDVGPGVATLGQKRGEFGWDNEFGQHQADVPGFRVSKYKITNGQYLDFVNHGAPAPHFWTRRATPTGDEWFYRGMFFEVPLPVNAPVYVTHAEASAYARWAGKRLLTEQEFHRAACGTAPPAAPATPAGETIQRSERPHISRDAAYPWGDAPPDETRGNFDFHHWDPVDVNANPAGDSALGVSQLVGNGWEWTSTQFGPFAGFQPMPFYPGYSQNFFDEEHYVMKGGSPVTAACMLRRSFRNWFRPNYPYVYASFRVVEN